MKKLIFPLLVLWGGLLMTGCNKDDGARGNVSFSGVSNDVSSAVINVYERTATETNFEIYLMLEGSDIEQLHVGGVYFDLYFEGSLEEFPAGTYTMEDGILETGEYNSNLSGVTEEVEIVSGTLTVGRKGNDYSFEFNGTASRYDSEAGNYLAPEPFSCSYSGPVTYTYEF